MSLVLGPLHSDKASGKFADSIVFTKTSPHRVSVTRFPIKRQNQDLSTFRRLCFARANYLWQNENLEIIEYWNAFAAQYPRKKNLSGASYATGQQAYISHRITSLFYDIPFQSYPPSKPTTDWFPEPVIEWTSSGALLTITGSIPTNCRIIVRERRNLKEVCKRARPGKVAYIFNEDDEPPFFVSGAIGEVNIPPGWPYIYGGSWLRWDCFSIDGFCRSQTAN